ncbi:MAG: DUF6165 family protein [bacterium]
MPIKIDISIGELVDKVTILSIKRKKIEDKNKRINIEREYELLSTVMEDAGIKVGSLEFKSLMDVNLKLWHIEDDIRIKEAKKEFDEEFIQLARSVYFENDKRAKIKKDINKKYNDELSEEKEYVDYQGKQK